MKWTQVLAILVVLIVIANVIALNALPDMIAGINLVVIVAIVAGIGYFVWRRNRKSKN